MMNERIRELGMKLGITDPEGKFYSPNYEMLGELIIKECMHIAKEYQNRGGNCYVDDKIKEHFGVES